MEMWKDIKDYEGLYQVNNYGRIRSLDKLQDFYFFSKGNKNGNSKELKEVLRPGRFMKTTTNSFGYKCVGLYKNKKVKYSLIHRLVAEAFLIPDSKRKHVNHMDSNPGNNKVENLEWCTPAENLEHARKYGGLKDISKKVFVNNAKLADTQILEIIELKRKHAMPNRVLAEQYGLTRRSIDRIISGDAYTWVKRINIV